MHIIFFINTHDNSNQAQYQCQPSFNYADKLVEYLEKTLSGRDAQIAKLKEEIELLKKRHLVFVPGKNAEGKEGYDTQL